jgi:hypothetical protein
VFEPGQTAHPIAMKLCELIACTSVKVYRLFSGSFLLSYTEQDHSYILTLLASYDLDTYFISDFLCRYLFKRTDLRVVWPS